MLYSKINENNGTVDCAIINAYVHDDKHLTFSALFSKANIV